MKDLEEEEQTGSSKRYTESPVREGRVSVLFYRLEIYIENFNQYRSDRSRRIRGRVAADIRKDLHCKFALSASNGTVEK